MKNYWLFAAAAVIMMHPPASAHNDDAITPEQRYAHAKQLESAGRVDEALIEFNKALDKKPDFARAHIMKGVCLSRKNLHHDAIKEYRTALEQGLDVMNQSVAHHNLGAEYIQLHQYDVAEKEFHEAIRCDPNFKDPKEALKKMKFMAIVEKYYGIISKYGRVFIYVAAIIIVPIFVFLHNHTSSRAVQQLADSLQGSVEASFGSRIFKGIHHGHSYTVRVLPPTKHQPHWLLLDFEAHSGFTMRIAKKTFADKGFDVFRRLLFQKIVAVTDQPLSDKYVVTAKDPSEAEVYLKKENVLGAVHELINLGFENMVFKKSGISVRKNIKKPEVEITPELIRNAVKEMAALALKID